MSKQTLFASLFCGLIGIVSQPMSLEAASPTLAGSWQFTLTPATPPIPSIPVPGLATFTPDGSVIETDAMEVVPGPGPTYGTPGHGIWQLSPAFTNFFVQFTSIVANHNGSLHAKTTTTMTVALDSTGTQFSGGYTSQVVDPTGHVTKMISGQVAGQLIPHPLLP
jgi:hypothetical protein